MQLNEWVNVERGRIAALARQLGIAPSVVTRMASGQKQVPLAQCPFITRHTGGAVTCEELRPDMIEFFAMVRAQPAPPARVVVELRSGERSREGPGVRGDGRGAQRPHDHPDPRKSPLRRRRDGP